MYIHETVDSLKCLLKSMREETPKRVKWFLIKQKCNQTFLNFRIHFLEGMKGKSFTVNQLFILQLQTPFTGVPICFGPHRNSYTKGCVKMRALQQKNKLFIVNLSLFWGTVCICRPTWKKGTDQNVIPVIFQNFHQT